MNVTTDVGIVRRMHFIMVMILILDVLLFSRLELGILQRRVLSLELLHTTSAARSMLSTALMQHYLWHML